MKALNFGGVVIRWKTVRTVYICRTLALFVGGATPTIGVEATAHIAPPERGAVIAVVPVSAAPAR